MKKWVNQFIKGDSMIGFVITGHNKFASGIASAVEMVAGSLENTVIVDFLPEDEVKKLDMKIKDACNQIHLQEGIVIFADLVGGSPFNRSMIFMTENPKLNIHVIGGINLPLLIEAFNSRPQFNQIKELVDSIMDVSSETITYGNKILENDMNK
jgi:PTS system N-acetylgalactosamine-specific IIA component